MKSNPRILPEDATTAKQIASIYKDENKERVDKEWNELEKRYMTYFGKGINVCASHHNRPEILYAIVYRAVCTWDMEIVVDKPFDACYVLWVSTTHARTMAAGRSTIMVFDAKKTVAQQEDKLMAFHRLLFPDVAIPCNSGTPPGQSTEQTPPRKSTQWTPIAACDPATPPTTIEPPTTVPPTSLPQGPLRVGFLRRIFVSWVLTALLVYIAMMAVDHEYFTFH